MANNTDFTGLEFSVAGHYVLVFRESGQSAPTSRAFVRMEDLAAEVAWRYRQETFWGSGLWRSVMLALSPNGKCLSLLEVQAYGQRLYRAARDARRSVGACVFRQGPVPGIRCYRPGQSCSRQYHRRLQTTAERRLGALVLKDEGEVAPRAKRQPSNIPHSWFDFQRERQRGWKSQHRGRKAWDRPNRRPSDGEGW